MKHRSVVIFVVIIATLATTPQAARQLLSMEASLGNRVRAGIWCAILDSHAPEGAVEVAESRPLQVTTSNVKGTDANATASRRVSSDRQNDVTGALFIQNSPSRQAASLLKKHPELKFTAARELAMMMPIETDVRPVSTAAESLDARALRHKTIEPHLQLPEPQNDAAFIDPRFGGHDVRFTLSGVGVRRQLDSLLNELGIYSVARGEIRRRLIKVKQSSKPDEKVPPSRQLCPKKLNNFTLIASVRKIAPPVPASE